MGLRLHSHFLDALAELSGGDQKRVRAAVRQLGDPELARGLRPHSVGDFMSFSATMDLRILAMHEQGGFVLVHVAHHDDAYRWGNTHSAILDSNDLVLAILPTYEQRGDLVESAQRAPSSTLRARYAGLPSAIASALESAADDAELIEIIAALSPEWQEMALVLANYDSVLSEPSDIVAVDDELLQFALALPADKWRVFLHPRQRAIVDLPAAGHLLVRGGPGTGKTVCLVHRFVRLSGLSKGKPPLLVALNRPAREALEDACKSLGHNPRRGSIVDFDDLNERAGLMDLAAGHSAVLIDEGQDLRVGLIARLLENLEQGKPVPPLTIAYDPNQAIIEPSGEALTRLLPFSDAVTLTYCYRTTSEILRYSAGVLNRLHMGFSGKNFQHQHHIDARRDPGTALMTTAVTGPEVDEVIVDEHDLLEFVSNRALELQRSLGSWNGVGIIVVGEAERALSYLNERGVPARVPNDVKGLEFFRGIVIDQLPPSATADGPTPTTAAGYRAQSGLYVAVTRFRDHVTLVTSHPSNTIGSKP